MGKEGYIGGRAWGIGGRGRRRRKEEEEEGDKEIGLIWQSAERQAKERRREN